MKHTLIYAGELKQHYIIPPSGIPHSNVPGGDLLYAATGGKLWVDSITLLARVGENYPSEWFSDFAKLGLNSSGIRVMPQYIESKTFESYDQHLVKNIKNPASSYLNNGYGFPKELLNYSSDKEITDQKKLSNINSPRISDIPEELLGAKVLHLSPLELMSQTQLASFFQQNNTTIITVDPHPDYMEQRYLPEIKNLLNGITIFTPTESQVRKVFWGSTNDLWEMAERLSVYECEFVVIKLEKGGQAVFERATKNKWQIPAYPSNIKDPSGCSAAFAGGVTAGFYLTFDIVEAVLYGNVTSSICSDGTGAAYIFETLPDLARSRLKLHREQIKRI